MRQRSSPRKRPTKAATAEDAAAVEPMDEDDQEALIQELAAKSQAQQQSIFHSFQLFCGAIALTSNLLALTTDWQTMATIRPTTVLHGLMGGLVAWRSTCILSHGPEASQIVPLLLVYVFQLAATLAWQRLATPDQPASHHYAMAVAHLLLVAAAFWIHHDNRSTQQVVAELMEAKYKHKSL